MHNRKAVTKVLYHVFVILFGFMMVYPVLWMISGSFKGNAEILRGTLSLIPKELKLTNYATGWKGFGGTTFATFFKNSIFITVIATFGTVISSSLVAYALSRVRFRGRKFWFTCMLVTMMLMEMGTPKNSSTPNTAKRITVVSVMLIVLCPP